LRAGDKVPADDKPIGVWRRVRLADGRFGLIAPRLGYAAALGPKVVMWPRVGFTVVKLSIDDAGDTFSDTAYALTVEVPLVFIVAPHVFLSVAPTLDVGLGGSVSSASASMSQDQTVTSFGLQAALGAFF
jgi:hypothetical protein